MLVTDFEGLAIQQVHWLGNENELTILVMNNVTKWNRTVNAVIDEWFDIVVGWNKKDGIAVKINNKLVKEGKVWEIAPVLIIVSCYVYRTSK